MPRNSEYLQANPVRLDVSRSKRHVSPRWTGTFNAGELVPIYLNTDILPATTVKVSYAMACRSTTPECPVMDDLFMDVSFYWVPHKLILSRAYMSPSTSDSNHSWAAFIGAQDSLLNMPVPAGNIKLPYMTVTLSTAPDNAKLSSIASYFGLALRWYQGASDKKYRINCLGALAFMAVWNENFREPSVQTPGVFSISSGQCGIVWAASTGDNSIHVDLTEFALPNVCRLHSIFGSCLPWPQRNTTGVVIPIDDVPVYADELHGKYSDPLIWRNLGTNFATTGDAIFPEILHPSGTSPISGNTVARTSTGYSQSVGSVNTIAPANLWADLSNASLYVNTLRAAVQAQRWFEALARGGNRLDELLSGMFGVVPKDAGQDRPEYLGGKRVPITMSQVNATINNNDSDLGQTGAFSLTNDASYLFTKSFDTHGSLVGVCCVRFRDSFCNRIPRQFKRFERFDEYWCQFANLGEEAIYKHEVDIYQLPLTSFSNDSLDGVDVANSGVPKVFGYQEYAAEYRYPSDIVCGHAASYADMKYWTYCNDFGSEVNLGDFLIGKGIKEAVDRTLKVSSTVAGFQFLAQFQFEIDMVQPMPAHSIPGLVDHH